MNQGPLSFAYYGFFYAPTGYGRAARSYLYAMDGAGAAVSAVNIGQKRIGPTPDVVLGQAFRRRSCPDLHLWHSEPEDLRPILNLLPNMVVMTTWEADRLSARYVVWLNRAREIWVPSRYNEEHFRQQLKVPIRRMPHPVYLPPTKAYSRARLEAVLGIRPETFLVSAIGTWQKRKNLEGALAAFALAFADIPEAELVLKTSLIFMDREKVQAQVAKALMLIPEKYRQSVFNRIHLDAEHWEDEEMAALRDRTNCHVSLHRGEGWGYTAFDAATVGCPVVATGYSGPLDFLDPEKHQLVGYELAHPDQSEQKLRFGFTSEMCWAEPDLVDAAQRLRYVYCNYAHCKRLAEEAAVEIRERYSLESIGAAMVNRMRELEMENSMAATA